MRDYRSFAIGVLVGGALLLACGGITQNVELLRAQRVEIVDGSDNVTMELGSTVRALQERVSALEARQPD